MDVESRARQSLGSSSESIYLMVQSIVAERVNGNKPIKLLDVGCGSGNLYRFIGNLVGDYEGVDVVKYDGFPTNTGFHKIDLDSGRADLSDEYADIVVAVETIEHLENPRAFFRELTRLCKPDGWVILTTPNQLSLLSKLTLLLKNQFNAFTDTNYPAHITALLEVDLWRIATECKLENKCFYYTCKSRIPGTRINWPKWLSKTNKRLFSDNIGFCGKRSGR